MLAKLGLRCAWLSPGRSRPHARARLNCLTARTQARTLATVTREPDRKPGARRRATSHARYLQDTRRQLPAFGLAERPMLEAWLDFHRTTLLMKCEGLTDSQRQTRPVPT